MNYSEIISIDDSKWFNVLIPVKRAKSITENPCVIGFDTEYVTRESGNQETISIQFASDTLSRVISVSIAESYEDLLLKSLVAEVLTGSQALPTSINPEEDLFYYLFVFLHEAGVREFPHDIYLISHFAQAELSNFNSLDNADVFQSTKGLSAKFKVTNLFTKAPVIIHVIDLFNLFSTSLDRVGNYIGIQKLSLEGVDGKTEHYWKEHMDELFKQFPKKFREYAIRDAEICYQAYTKIREFFLTKYNVDILHFGTLPSIAGYIFRKDYLKEPVASTRTIEVGKNQKKRLAGNTEKFYPVVQKQQIYDGSLDVRKVALFSYHGARVESYYRGRIEDAELSYYDVVSLYPSSAMLQPLPAKDTAWFNLVAVDSEFRDILVQDGEGFVEVEFSFPDDVMFPCLPVQGARDNVLYYPLNGISWCTLSELRLAIKLGLTDYKVLSGYAFLPTDKERNHPLKHYMEAMLENKNSSAKGTIEYELFKLLMNALVGKLVERNEERTPLELVRDGLIPREALNRVTRKLTKSKSVGSLWYPEGASLILGKARAIISEFVTKGAYFVSTDSVLLHSSVDINCNALEELRSVGSDLKKEFDVAHGILVRTRLYALNPLEEDSSKQHIARHGVHCNTETFLDKIRYGYITRQIPDLTYPASKLIKYNESLRTGRALNSKKTNESSIKIKFDGKRKLTSPVDNPFSESSWSVPLSSAEVRNNKQRKPAQAKSDRKVGTRKITENKRAITELYQRGFTQSKICEELRLSKGYVSKVVKQIREQGETHNA